MSAEHVNETKQISLRFIPHWLSVPEALCALRVIVRQGQRYHPEEQVLDDHGTMQQVVFDAFALVVEEEAHFDTVTHGCGCVVVRRHTISHFGQLNRNRYWGRGSRSNEVGQRDVLAKPTKVWQLATSNIRIASGWQLQRRRNRRLGVARELALDLFEALLDSRYSSLQQRCV